MSFYKAGIDIGSTTIKFVVMDENNNICFKDYGARPPARASPGRS